MTTHTLTPSPVEEPSRSEVENYDDDLESEQIPEEILENEFADMFLADEYSGNITDNQGHCILRLQ